jgi:Tol biopolymer transport system component
MSLFRLPNSFPSICDRRIVGALSFAAFCVVARAQVDTTYAVSVPASGTSVVEGQFPTMTPDGHFVAFTSMDPTLVAGDTNNLRDVFVRDMTSGVTERVSVTSTGAQSLGASYAPSISDDGRYVAFCSIAPLVLADTNNRYDIYVRDRVAGTTTRVSVDSAGAQGNDNSGDNGPESVSISGDGQLVAFHSFATNLVAGDTNGERDIFLHDMQTGQTTLEGINPNGTQASASVPKLSGDGHYLVFLSILTSGGGNFLVYRRDLAAGTTALVSVNQLGGPANRSCSSPSVTYDGRYIAFVTDAFLAPGDGNTNNDAFMRDMQAPGCVLVSLNTDGLQADGSIQHTSISSDGRFVSFDASANHWFAGQVPGIHLYLRDRQLSTLRSMSVGPTGIQAPSSYNSPASISSDGTMVCFASNTLGQFFGNNSSDPMVFIRVDTTPPAPFTVLCSGNGTCPCLTGQDQWAGCPNSHQTYGGATITALGNPSVSNDTIQLVATGMGSGAPALFFQGTALVNGGAGAVFGEGLRCVAGSVRRFPVRTANVSVSMGHGIGSDAPISVTGQVPGAGGTRYYQAWYRDAAVFCTLSTFNLTNAISIVWQP